MKFDLEKYNNILKDGNQLSIISFYKYNPREITVNGISYTGNTALRVIRRLTGDELWVKNFDKIYVSTGKDLATEKLVKSLISAKGGKACQIKHGDTIKSNLNTGVPWNKNMKGNYPITQFWQTGLTKYTDQRLKNLSEDRHGKGNPMYGIPMSEEDKVAKSIIMKQKILDGTFTPNSNNRNTHWDSYCVGIKFRSSWEAFYYSNNLTDEYETLRIKYMYDTKEYVYIVDFVNHATKTATEIKPSELLNNPKMQAKLLALGDWCTKCNYTIQCITEKNIFENASLDNIHLMDTKSQNKIKKLYETYIKNRNK